MALSLSIIEFIKFSEGVPLIDVRTTSEYEQGHIPGALNISLFTNEERKIIGTLYKQQGRQPAILKGLEFVGPRLKEIILSVNKINREKGFLIYCWCGGMRSASIAWLLELYGYKVYLLKGGYKSFRKFIFEKFTNPRKVLVLAGRTGAAKTLVLNKLLLRGEQIIDLEHLAGHKGSSFGSLGEKEQPSQEAFENRLAMALYRSDSEKILWLEDESRMVGQKVIPAALWEQMRKAKVFYIDVPFAERVHYLVKEYGKFSKEELIKSTERIRKRLGSQNARRAIEAIKEGDLKTACEINLVYYDKAYDYGINKREPQSIIKFYFDSIDSEEMANQIVKFNV